MKTQKLKFQIMTLISNKKWAPKDKLLTKFENHLYELINDIKFRKYQKSFTRKLNNDLKEIRSAIKVFVFADKSHSVYKISPNKYKKLIIENITSTYKNSENSLIEKVNNEAEEIVMKIKGKIPKLSQQQCYITLKDHKSDFPNKLSCRIINPVKTFIGKPAKQV